MFKHVATLTLTVATVLVTGHALGQTPGDEQPATPATQPAPSPAPPQGEGEAEPLHTQGGEYRTVNGHAFITPVNAYSAFTNTSFRFVQGFGVATFELPSVIDGTSTPGRLFLYGQQLSGQIGIINRVSIDVRAQGTAAVGGDLNTIIGIGALALLNVGAMPKVRLFTLEEVGLQASVGVGIYYDRNITVRPSALIGKALGEVQGTEGQLVQQTEALNVVPALMLAEGTGPVGLQVSAAPRLGAAGAGATNGFDVGVHAAMNFAKIPVRVPVALTAEYGLSAGAGDASHFVGGGVYYSGRRDFELGAVAGLAPTGTIQIYQGQLVMQYYF